MTKLNKNIAYMETSIIKNEETGEIVEKQEAKQFKAEVEPSYVKLYLEDIAYFNGLNIKSDLLYELLKYVNYKHEIIINKTVKTRIADSINKSLSYVNNNITKLVKDEVLIRIGTGTYELNSYLFGKGSWKDILKHRKSLQLNLFYDWRNGRTVEKTA